ncbi:MAG: lipopolysaccharide biosynthesis protein, partial [Pseudomonas sp.]
GVGALESVVGKRVLVAIPFISTQAELARRKKWRTLLIVAGVVLVAILLVLVHLLYMPLDLLLFKAMARFE